LHASLVVAQYKPLIADKILAKKQPDAWIACVPSLVRYRTAAPKMADRLAFQNQPAARRIFRNIK
jgi:hypothetical protein